MDPPKRISKIMKVRFKIKVRVIELRTGFGLVNPEFFFRGPNNM